MIMDVDWNGLDLEKEFNLFISGLFEKAGIDIVEGTNLDIALEQDYAQLLEKLENHLDFAVRVSNTLD
jgi:hypothetical protein